MAEQKPNVPKRISDSFAIYWNIWAKPMLEWFQNWKFAVVINHLFCDINYFDFLPPFSTAMDWLANGPHDQNCSTTLTNGVDITNGGFETAKLTASDRNFFSIISKTDRYNAHT